MKKVEIITEKNAKEELNKFIQESDNKHINMCIEFILNSLEEQEQINEEHRKLNGKLREEIKQLKKQKEDIIDLVESEI